MYSKNSHIVSIPIMTVFQKKGEEHLFGNNFLVNIPVHHQNWIRIRRRRFRIRQKKSRSDRVPDPDPQHWVLPNRISLYDTARGNT